MRILIISDLHANPWALEAVEQAAGQVDYVLCAGDVVSYGPRPNETVAWLRRKQAIVVQGNHDHAIAFHAETRASPAKLAMAVAMRDWTRLELEPDELAWLSRLPLYLTWEAAGPKVVMMHATPMDHLYDYSLKPDIPKAELSDLVHAIRADVLVVGHTHLPFLRDYHGLQVVNPGSVGQPLDGDLRAAFALWEDGVVTLQRADYDQKPLLAALSELTIERELREKLKLIVRNGRTE